ncbi:NAD(P)/FAD-dependent oxidoreductase [Aeromicrobium wangtongii]|uniref:NAD(P)/FAD-dependent oxidoreductase n=1 Tax=Aeromicrobium wangtongii TaxID=2969247 RepID=UPI002017B58F|nr:FAD-dependent oxidoreductase [Aeromicrobium wangtongii]MCL3819421.1 FAD-dependent oxidoreductase [Aeromicrobium wangtongii]
MTSHETFVIVGANLAGGRAAESLRLRGFAGRVVLVGEEPYGPYERPPLSKQVLKGTMTPDDTLLRPTEGWESSGVELLTGRRITRLLPSESRVELDDGRALAADKVLLCTGARVRRLAVEGADLAGVHYLRTLEDALAVRERLLPGAPVVVIGAGFIGAEVAASAREVGCEVTLVELAPLPMSRVLGDDIAAAYVRFHRDRGVDVRTGVGVDRIEGTGGEVRAVVTTDGARLEASLVVIGVGIAPADELARAAGIAVDNGIVVDEFCQTSNPAVLAAGDVANAPNALMGRRVRFEHWQNAQNQAVAAAGTMLGEQVEFCELPWFWSDQFDLGLQLTGDPSSGDRVVVRGAIEDADFCAFYLADGAMVGAVALNRPRELRAAMGLVRRRAVIELDALADAMVDLRALGRARA